MQLFRRSSEQGLTAYLRLPGRIAYARVDRRVAVPRLLAAGVATVKGDNWGEALAQLHGKGPVSLVLKPADYRLRLLDAPNVPADELKSAVRWQIQDMLDFHADDGTVDVLEVPHPEHVSHAKQIFAVAAKNSLLAEEAVLATNAGLNLTIIDIMETAQRNVATRLETPGRALALFSFIETGGLLTLTLDGELCMARTLGVNQTVLDIEGLESVLERLTLEIQRSLDHFDRQFGGIPVDRLLLAPMENVEGLCNGLAGNLALPVKPLDLAEVLDIAALPEANTLPPHCFHAIGAALRMEETKP
ncbi:agglutinin biogenesis protein MshI [Thiobacillus sp.]|uniref:agglutinin biogenesis protein MshI n=1 Tax=Thiobacillus sp. TaxID=924 RepID=UPI001D4E6D3C|nr:agglutinin biogenesis protein MshI [Thiobacillus sp.]MBC2759350.1 agglutinin biogenesis protein MshI [Thiobacillus sp.]